MAGRGWGEELGDTPTSVTHVPWLYESRQENEDRNVYLMPMESGKWMMFYDVRAINQAWSRAKDLYRSGQLPDVKSMKVSTAMATGGHSANQNVLIFYCGPASNENKMIAIGRDLAQKMDYSQAYVCYKTDQQTIQGIRGSIYKIKLK
ncbi:hypothetical protein ACOMHN_049166 [Nucella lapillus]